MFYTYMMRTTKDTLYTGQTNNLNRRVKEHESKSKRASKYIRSFLGSKLVYFETFLTRKEATKREAELKRLTHTEKEKIIKYNKNPISSLITINQ